MTDYDWIHRGPIDWLEGQGYGEDETVLVYFRGTTRAAVADGLTARHRPPFARGEEPAPGEWGVIVHPMLNPSRNDYDDIDYRGLCPEGAELVVFVPNPCIVKAHDPKAYHYRDGRISSCVDYEGAERVGERWPNALAPLVTAAGLGIGGEFAESPDHEQRLTALICEHLGLPALDRAAMTVDRELMDDYQ
ncbi:hypothetical protein [Kitasatospora sp. SC0581]|uniref:hypothetical protein n=1 Tax=Kitasatospora sp. SC0581 TaxID=3394360 RepID=UPI003A876BC6